MCRCRPAETTMKFEDRLEHKLGRDTGFRVPEGYFQQMQTEVAANLPLREEIRPARLSRWHRVRPYVYLAAMFAGIWCMMKMFHTMSGERPLDLENPPALVAQALADPSSDPLEFDRGPYESGQSGFELEEEVVDSYEGIDELVEDFDYTFNSNYRDLQVTN